MSHRRRLPRLPIPAHLALLLALVAAAPHAAHAQILQGRAIDRFTQQPVPDAEIVLVDAQGEAAATVRSGVDGTFRVTGAGVGDYRVAARKLGYQAMLSNVVRLGEGQLVQVEARLTPQQAEGTVVPAGALRGISGQVVESGTGRPIPGASVALLNRHGQHITRVTADAAGGFHLPVPGPDRYQLRAERVGYQRSTSDAITVVPSDVVRVELLMSTDAVVLAPLTVVASSRSVARNSRMAAFEWRQEHHPWGRFIGPDRIARIRPFYVTDVLQQVPFVQIQGNGPVRNPTLRGPRGRCIPTVYVDGHASMIGGGVTIDELVSGPDIAAVEVYDRPFEAPAEFLSNSNPMCGVIVIWTRPPGEPA